jgi:hypothetical protein
VSFLPLFDPSDATHTGDMTAFLIALLALVLLDVAVIAGWTPDSRDGRDWWWREWPPRHLRSRVRRESGV